MMSLLSKAVSAIKAPNSRPSISGCDPDRVEALSGQQLEADQIAQSIGGRATILVVMPPLERPITWLAVPLLRLVRGRAL